ncbi:MAG TPA: cupin domain-containing protein, partial [Steroidobacteraceae bacterium]|nr:cupin domain-containing protein [Steroidobacteraceae bacterium]
MSKIIRFSPLGDPERSTPAPDRIVHGKPEQLLWNVYSDAKGWFHVGRWSSTPGSWRVQYTENELCHLLSGRICLRDAQGTAYDFGAG